MNLGEAAARPLRLNDEILQIAHNPEVTYRWFVAHRLLWSKDVDNRRCSRVGCPSFGQLMTFAIENGKPDGGRFRCNGPCPHRLSPRDDTIFAGLRIPLVTIHRLLFHHFLENHSITLAAARTQTDRQTVSRIYLFARFAIHMQELTGRILRPVAVNLIVEQEHRIYRANLERGALGHRRLNYNSPAVEVDECMLTHMNNEQVWVVGIWDHAERRAIVHVVENRTAATLERLIRTYVRTVPVVENLLARTRVYHDGWAGYNFLYQGIRRWEGFRVVHAGGHFGRGRFSINRIESFWSDLQRVCNFYMGRHFTNLRQIEADVGNWRIRNRQANKVELLADLLFRMTRPGGGDGTTILSLDGDNNGVADVNGGLIPPPPESQEMEVIEEEAEEEEEEEKVDDN